MPNLNVKILDETMKLAKEAAEGQGMLLRVWVEKVLRNAASGAVAGGPFVDGDILAALGKPKNKEERESLVGIGADMIQRAKGEEK